MPFPYTLPFALGPLATPPPEDLPPEAIEPTTENESTLALFRDIASDENGDWALDESGDIRVASGFEAIQIDAESRLRMWKGEAFWDLDEGTDYPLMLEKGTSLLTLRAIFTERILGTPGVFALTNMDVEFDVATRELSVDWRATTDVGELGAVTRIGAAT